jgi:hypothetical protein
MAVAVAAPAVSAASAAAATAAPAGEGAGELWLHRIERGDTLIGLHARLLQPQVRWQELQRLNRIANPRRLQPGSTLKIPLSMLRRQPAAAEVLHVHGEVFLEGPGGSRRPLAAAAAVAAGEQIVTGPQSSASLRFADGTRTALGPDSRLRVQDHARLGSGAPVQMRLQLERGSVQTRVPALQPPTRLELGTPVVNLGVRGTEFRARVDDGRTLAEVVQGRVAVGAQLVEAGFGTRAEAGAVLAPQPLLPAPALQGLAPRLERTLLRLALPAGSGVQHYRLQVHDRGTPSRLLAEGVFAAPLASWLLPLPDGSYRLLARAADDQGIEGQDAQADFELAARPEPPFLLRPRADESLDQDPLVLTWSRNPEAARYRLQVAASDDFAQPVLARDDVAATEAELSLTSLPPGRYHWRVASVRADGHRGPWGDAQALVRLAPPPQPPVQQPSRLDETGITLSWSAAALAGARYQLQVAADAAFGAPSVDLVTDETRRFLPGLAPGRHFVRVRTLAPDQRHSEYGTAQIVEVPEPPPPSRWWLWLLPLTLLLVP